MYLSQFSDFGNLTNLIHSRNVSDDLGAGGIPGVLAGEVKQAQQTGIERHFDTQWSQVLNFLDEVQTRQMLRRQLDGTPIGSLVLLPGTMMW